MNWTLVIKICIAVVFAVLTGGATGVVAHRSGKTLPAALLAGITVGTAALSGVTPILFS